MAPATNGDEIEWLICVKDIMLLLYSKICVNRYIMSIYTLYLKYVFQCSPRKLGRISNLMNIFLLDGLKQLQIPFHQPKMGDVWEGHAWGL